MKLLVDENLSRRMLPALQAHYPASTHVCLIGLERATDAEIWEYAARECFVIVTRDSDFSDLAVVRGSPPQVIHLSVTNCRREHVARLLIEQKAC
ncbi:hypothetical protein B1A_00713 [mine drainage metagenome]|uniref:DUF5615 domain-containing protein n=1 Tax=mine drainage metagenome TaxID=410659 RepID=T1CDS4_9ZZZZ